MRLDRYSLALSARVHLGVNHLNHAVAGVESPNLLAPKEPRQKVRWPLVKGSLLSLFLAKFTGNELVERGGEVHSKKVARPRFKEPIGSLSRFIPTAVLSDDLYKPGACVLARESPSHASKSTLLLLAALLSGCCSVPHREPENPVAVNVAQRRGLPENLPERATLFHQNAVVYSRVP